MEANSRANGGGQGSPCSTAPCHLAPCPGFICPGPSRPGTTRNMVGEAGDKLSPPESLGCGVWEPWPARRHEVGQAP